MTHTLKTLPLRSLALLLVLLLALGACSSKDDAIEDPMAHEGPPKEEISNIANEVPSERAEAEIEKQIKEGAETPSPYVELNDVVPTGPLAAVLLKDGTQYEVMKIDKLGKYYLYISGKLNGRSSTVVSLTRFQDLQRWRDITFQDAHNFTITTHGGKALRFVNSRMYLGSTSHDTFSFYVADGMEDLRVEVKKSDVQIIMFAPPKREE